MNREDKIKLLIDNGFTCDPENGIVYGIKGNQIKSKTKGGYGVCAIKYNNKQIRVLSHIFMYYYVNNVVPDTIDHINGDKMDNRIVNLRNVSQQVNQHNRRCKGYTYIKSLNKYKAQITYNGKVKYIGLFDTPDSARNAYLLEKKKLHIEIISNKN